ncbi:wax ester/triacylglycerol synthase domain-containing protein [Blastococcus tunisiensis]|uniref:diacylglycerol O-acyltransferase n=1 Tax=Blastococcus tunisiensis TaxID=1798228 RepID=A0A1I2DZX5_9ACTN|nr:wax ester/triacylglycerol synthase domain-containing protein [Blastococcus sp. DSM 46838]SFE86125.1 acyltransferase, WS/DGAT/MGAT [Blastococcus sp. DSM 46838]
MRAMDARSPVPQNVGALLVIGGAATDLPELERVLVARAAAVPRLRQRLVPLPPGCGRPLWLESADFDAAAHVRHVRCPEPGDERALLDLVASVVAERLPTRRPLWSAVFVSGLPAGRIGLVLVVHHVLADGLGGLAVLVRLLDRGPGVVEPIASRRAAGARPSWRRLAADALRTELAALRRLPAAWRDLRRATRAGGGLRSAPAAPCSLLARTGGRPVLAVVRADLAGLRTVAHRHGGTGNDAVLGAVGGALHTVLARRGEAVRTFRVAVMVSARRAADPTELGNRVTPLLVDVPGDGSPEDRLRRIAGTVGRAREQATGPAVVSVLGPVFRWAARLGLYRMYMTRQRRLHTLVSTVRGPVEPATLGGLPVSAIVPVALGEPGNVTVSFVVLSYAGTLTVTVTVTADASVDDLPVLAASLQAELDALVSAGTARRG